MKVTLYVQMHGQNIIAQFPPGTPVFAGPSNADAHASYRGTEVPAVSTLPFKKAEFTGIVHPIQRNVEQTLMQFGLYRMEVTVAGVAHTLCPTPSDTITGTTATFEGAHIGKLIALSHFCRPNGPNNKQWPRQGQMCMTISVNA